MAVITNLSVGVCMRKQKKYVDQHTMHGYKSIIRLYIRHIFCNNVQFKVCKFISRKIINIFGSF